MTTRIAEDFAAINAGAERVRAEREALVAGRGPPPEGADAAAQAAAERDHFLSWSRFLGSVANTGVFVPFGDAPADA